MRKLLIKKLNHHQRWRKGADIPMLSVRELSDVLDNCIKVLENMSDEQVNDILNGKKS